MREAVESGLSYTAMRAFKHRDEPMDEDDLRRFLSEWGVNYVMDALYETIDFDESEVLEDSPPSDPE